VERRAPGGPDSGFEPVDSLTVAGERHLSFEGAVPHEYATVVSAGEIVDAPKIVEIEVPGHRSSEPLAGEGGVVGRLTCHRRALQATVEIGATAEAGTPGLTKLSVRVTNRADDVGPEATRPQALASSLVACHTLISIEDGAFLSLLEPPAWAAEAARSCRHVGAFPVLAGPAGSDHTVLSSPSILYDYPRVAPESPGDLFDASEIDEILSLRTLTLTEAEKAEARATDRRAAEIVDRVESLPEEVLSRLHGAVRYLRPSRVGGVPARGSKVRLRPSGRVDAQDMFLYGRAATVEAVMADVDGSHFVAVTVDGDPRAEIDAGPGRLRHFRLDELEEIDQP